MSNIDQADVVWLRAVRRMGGDVDLVMLVMNDAACNIAEVKEDK